MEELKNEVKEGTLVETFDEEIEGYGNCGSSSEKYECKKDCIFVHNSIISAIK